MSEYQDKLNKERIERMMLLKRIRRCLSLDNDSRHHLEALHRAAAVERRETRRELFALCAGLLNMLENDPDLKVVAAQSLYADIAQDMRQLLEKLGAAPLPSIAPTPAGLRPEMIGNCVEHGAYPKESPDEPCLGCISGKRMLAYGADFYTSYSGRQFEEELGQFILLEMSDALMEAVSTITPAVYDAIARKVLRVVLLKFRPDLLTLNLDEGALSRLRAINDLAGEISVQSSPEGVIKYRATAICDHARALLDLAEETED